MALGFGSVPSAYAASPDANCRAPANLLSAFTAPLPRFAKAFQERLPIKIIALGSSSTAGAGASSRDKQYPARLRRELAGRFADRSFEVVNAGVNGQFATDMLRRMDKDVLSRGPTLVIWQTGVNDAIAQVNIEKFRATLGSGLDRLKERSVDVVLMDAQYYPRSEKLPRFMEYVAVMREVAARHGVPLLNRYQIMKHLVTSGRFEVKQLLAKDGFHSSDLGYECLGDVLADALANRLAKPRQAVSEPAVKPRPPGKMISVSPAGLVTPAAHKTE